MEFYRRAVVMSLCRLVLRAWPKTFAVFPSLLKNDQELVGPSSPMEESTANKDSLNLPEEILGEIFALLEIPDLVRAGCVCSSWRTAYSSLRSSGLYSRQQTPCLLYTSESADDDIAFLYSLAEKRIYKLSLPEPLIRSRYLIGSSNGWLVTADERSELHIVNPITGEQIALPSVTTIEQVKPIFDDSGAVQQFELLQYYGEEEIGDPYVLAIDKLRDELYIKAFVFFDSSKGSYVVVLIHNPICQLSFSWAGDSKWTWLPPSADYEDCIYIDGVLYAITSLGGIDAFDLNGPAFLRKVIMDNMRWYSSERMYIAQAPSGDLLQVLRDQRVANGNDPERDRSQVTMETREVMVYKVNMGAKELAKISSLDGYALFLGCSQSLCLSVEEYPQLKANHVYLTDDDRDAAYWNSSCRDVCVINLENNSKKEIVAPQPWCNWPAPIWITLNLAKLSSSLKK